MRELKIQELSLVSGAGGSASCTPCTPCTPCVPDPCTPTPTRQKNNNGYGNLGESGRAPGRSGDHNPQLLQQNVGPRGPR